MDEQKKMDTHPEGCQCHSCMGTAYCHFCSYGHRYWWLRWLIGLLVLLLVFWLGVKVGEVKTMFEGGDQFYGRPMRYYPMMGNGYWDNSSGSSSQNQNNLPPMMRSGTSTPLQQ